MTWSPPFASLDIPPAAPLMVHASLSAFGEVEGGAQTVVRRCWMYFPTVADAGLHLQDHARPGYRPPDNGLVYGTYADANRHGAVFPSRYAGRPVDGRDPGGAAHFIPRRCRSLHPILSFVGVNAQPFLESQTIVEPLAPFRLLVEQRGWVLLMGVDHTVNTAIHYAERLAGRKQFVRWALTPERRG